MALPSFAQQTGQPCNACHVGAFGPQLKPYGRDFKLFGYQSDDGKNLAPAVAFVAQTSFTHTDAPQAPPPHDFAANDNLALDQVSAFYGGKAPMGWGAFAQVTYSGVSHSFNLDNVDLRRATDLTIRKHDLVLGVDINNNPTVEDVWNSTPSWGFPYNSSSLAPVAAASTLLDGGLQHTVLGAGGYGMLDSSFYAAMFVYAPLERQFAGRLGEGVGAGSDRYASAIPYWRLALVHDIGDSATVEAGAYGLHAERYPAGLTSNGTDSLTDWALDANYQFIGSGRHELSAHATYIHEDQRLGASAALFGTRASNTLSTARADVSYSFADTWTPSLQMFATTGSQDPVLYPTGVRSSGYIAELAYTPWGKPNSPLYWANARLGLQYVAYTEFDGDHRGASANNTLYLSLWVALAPFGSTVHR